jgi:ribosome biogenesis protein BMS1
MSLLVGQDGEEAWTAMKLNVELRAERSLPTPVGPRDSQYKPIERTKRHFNPLHVPASLQKALPFSSKPKDGQTNTFHKKSYRAQRAAAVVLEADEKRRLTLMQQMATIRRDKDLKREAASKLSRQKHLANRAKEEARKENLLREHIKRTLAQKQRKMDQHGSKRARS